MRQNMSDSSDLKSFLPLEALSHPALFVNFSFLRMEPDRRSKNPNTHTQKVQVTVLLTDLSQGKPTSGMRTKGAVQRDWLVIVVSIVTVIATGIVEIRPDWNTVASLNCVGANAPPMSTLYHIYRVEAGTEPYFWTCLGEPAGEQCNVT